VEIAFITDLAAEWTYEENSVECLLQQPFSSALWATVLAQFGQTEGLLKVHMAYISRSDLGQHSTSKSALEVAGMAKSRNHSAQASPHRHALSRAIVRAGRSAK
jgi:hypothetical protein